MLKRIFPFLRWFPMSRKGLKADFLAGLTVSLVLIPQSMAYAALAGLPPWIGLYASFLPVIFGALWGSSNNLQTGPVAMGSLITGTILISIASPNSSNYILLASQLALIVGIIRIIVGFCNFALIANFISRPVVQGFTIAGAFVILTSQIPKMLGLTVPRSGWHLYDLYQVVQNIELANIYSILISGGSLALLFPLKKLFPKSPIALVVVVSSIAVVYFLDLSNPEAVAQPVSIVGLVPSGLPKFTFAVPSWDVAWTLLPGATAIAIVGFMEMYSVSNAIAAMSKQRLNINQECIGQGIAAISSSFSGGYSVSGSFSRTALDYACGSVTALSAVFTGLFVMVFILFFTDFLFFLPTAALAAIIIHSVLPLLNIKKLLHYLKVDRADGLAGVATCIVTILCAPHIERGILVGTMLAIVMYLYRTMTPHVALLGHHPDGSMREAEVHGLCVDPEMPMIRFDGRLYFANVSYFETIVLQTSVRFPNAKYIVIGCEGINAIDASGEEVLRELTICLRKSNVQLLFVGIKEPVWKVMIRSGLDNEIGQQHVFRSFQQAKEMLQQQNQESSDSPVSIANLR